MEGTGTDGRFKVIIVGAGVSGLYLAHALAKADMDYVVLDKHPVAPAWGSSISLFPSSVRILDQVGLHDAVAAKTTEMRDFHIRGPDGKTYASGPFFHVFADAAGYCSMTFERRVFLQTLYDELPDKSKVIEHARVSGIVEDEEATNGRVRVVLADGGVHEGDVVIGCDGIHSAVRQLLWERAHRLRPGLITVDEKQRIRATYTALTGIAPYQPGSVGGLAMSSTAHDGFSFLFLTQPDHLYFSYPNRLRFTDADADAVAARVLDCPVSETLVFGDIWKARKRGQLIALEEGVLSHWSLGRTVLCGDSAHKVTPNAGFGGNLSLEGAAVLANELYAAVETARKRGEGENKGRGSPPTRRFAAPSPTTGRPTSPGPTTSTSAGSYREWTSFHLPLPCIRAYSFYSLSLLSAARYIAVCVADAPKLSFVHFHERSGSVRWEKQRWERPGEKTAWPLLRSLGRTASSGPIALAISLYVFFSYVAGAWYLGFGRGVKTSLD
ncbi:FAD-dependent monooxygenase [Apiospora marii]|uniref:FAD-dependent monooxygenase n=1 Tax=Apiospora marii TaxID=335849 RepID=UPI00312FF8B1